MKVLGLLTVLLLANCTQQTNTRSPQGINHFNEATSTDFLDDSVALMPGYKNFACVDPNQSEFASNVPLRVNGRMYPMNTHFTIRRGEDGSLQAIAHLEDSSGENSDDFGSYDFLEIGPEDFSCDDLTAIPVTTDENGDVELGEYSLPVDILVAGKQKKPQTRKKKGGTTHCYREVKRLVRHKIKLTGIAAYMANQQLIDAGWKKYSYKRAPNGSVCVFNKGGKVTKSGGHKYGHIGIKGKGGIVNPQAGFDLKRPFLGCYYKA